MRTENLVALIALAILHVTYCQSPASDIVIVSVPSPPLFSQNYNLSLTCDYNTQKYRFNMFIHPRAGQISSSYSNYRIIVAGTLATLRVSKAGTYDEGIYYCIFNLIGGGPETVHQSVKLEYRNTTVIDTRFTRYEALVGEQQTLVCDARNAEYIQWHTSAGAIPDTSQDGRVSVVNGYLVFREVLLSDSGTYTCLASNAITLVSVNAELQVILRPSTEASPAILEVDEGDVAMFTCIVSGSPLPTAKWIEVSTAMEITNEDQTQTDLINSTVFRTHLTFSSVALEDIGSYKCMATSSYGEAESRVILDLVGTLGAIQGVTLDLVNQTNILVRWSSPVEANVLSYTVTWQSLSKSLNEVPQSYILDGPNPPNSYLITGLEKLTLYGVFVYATNERGRGVDSEQVNITTDAIAPDGPVQLMLFDIAPNSVEVEWDLSLIDDGGSPVTIIRLSYTEDGGQWDNVDVETFSARIPGLKFGTSYQIQAQPGNRIGFGPLSDSVTFTTSSDGYPGTPSHLSAILLTSQTVIVCFDPSSVGSPFESYVVMGAVVNGEGTRNWTVSVNDLEESQPNCTIGARITNLDPNTCYSYTLSVSNAQGSGQTSSPSNEVCTLELPTVVLTSPTGDPLSNANTTPVIIAAVIVGVILAAVVLVLVFLCCCGCHRLKQANKKYTLPDRRESSRSDAALMQFQTQSSTGNTSVLTMSSSSDDSPNTATTQISNLNPFVFPNGAPPTQSNVMQLESQFHHSGVRMGSAGPGSMNTSGSATHQFQPHSTHSLPHHTHNPHTTHIAPHYPTLPGDMAVSEQAGFEMIDNPYYKRFRLQNIPEHQEHINYAYEVKAPMSDMPPPVPPYYADDISETGRSEVSSLPIPAPAFGESYSQPSHSPKLKHNSHKHWPSPSNSSNQLQAHGSSNSFHTGMDPEEETDGTDFIDNNAYEVIPTRLERGYPNGNEYQGGDSQPRFEIKSQEPGAVFETVQFKGN